MTRSSHDPHPLTIEVAPMEGVTVFPLRLWLWLTSGIGAFTTPFLRVTPTFPPRRLSDTFAPELTVLAGVLPYRVVPQIMAAAAGDAARAAELIRRYAPVIDLNAGCPSPTCSGKGAGSGLLRDPGELHDFLSTLGAEMGPGCLSLKMRTGYEDHQEFSALLAALAGVPLARLTVHGRTRPQGYRGQARWDLTEAAARHLAPLPVIASGDVVSRSTLAGLRAAAPSIQGLMIGRGLLRNPWLPLELSGAAHVRIEGEVLVTAIECLGLLHSLFTEQPERLFHLVATGLGQQVAGLELAAWQQVRQQLLASGAAEMATGANRGRILGQLKMLWSYLRSGLPPEMFAPAPLRSRSLPDFLAAVQALLHARKDATDLPFGHAPERDWIYSGGRSAPEAGGL